MAMNDSTPNGERERPVGELLKQLSDEATTLVRKEIELAKAEMAEKGRKAGAGAGMFGAAAALGLLALGALTACFVLALDAAMPAWLAALVVALVYGAIAAALALTGKRKTEEAGPPVPEQAIDSVKEDVEWTKTRARSARR
jgi:uncharacterized membrane protein YqjE